MSSPTPSDKLFTYDRGSQAFLISAATSTTGYQQVALAAPVNSNVIGFPAIIERGQMNPNYAVQIDIAGTGALSALVLSILGSLDGINFYEIYRISDVTGTAPTGGIRFSSGAAQVRYISAALITVTVGSGAPTVTVSLCE